MLKWFFKIIFSKYLKEHEEMNHKRIKCYSEKIKEAENCINSASRNNVTNLPETDISSIEYKTALRRVLENGAFQYEIFLLKQKMISEMVCDRGTDISARNVQGMLRGIESLLINMEAGCKNIEA